ncbi:MAG: T9SS type A sorting domain-containing protein [Bacteroidetes bacterium]|jgi:hypothetical protein|nr:T9SS type A sorting domain-containing protein [Bacteroidota bacterium]
MKKVALFIIFIAFLIQNVLAQKERSNVWITGYSGNKIDFSNNNTTTSQGIYFPFKYFHFGNSNISDTSGHLILSSDGYNVYNSNGSYIDGGDTLVPHDLYIAYNGWSTESQTSIFLPMDSNKYYFVTPTFSDTRFADCQANNNCYMDLLLYSIIDMNSNGGAGKVVKRMQPLMQNANLRKTQMMACRHGNGKDWWLLKNEGDNANVHTFLFTQDSVYDKGIQAFAQPNWGPWDIRGQSTFNTDGSLYATTSHSMGTGLIFLANFDRCHGLLSNPIILQTPTNSQQNPNDTTWTESLSVGLAFSPSNKFLYVASKSNIYQYDLEDNTWFHVYGIDTSFLQFTDYETAYLAPDNKIYIGNFGGGSKQMSRIDNPDIKGAGCNFCPRCLRLDSLGANAYVGTPPCMPNYGLGAQVCWPLESSEIGDKRLETLEVYPNPSSTYIDVRYEIRDNRNATIELFTALGQRVYTSPISHLKSPLSIDVSNLSTGIYYLRVENLVKKVIIE